MSKKSGGPAFPELGNVGYNSDWKCEAGMTLRDYFAAKAMQGMLANHGMWDLVNERHADVVAKDAYQVADAMLKAREE